MDIDNTPIEEQHEDFEPRIDSENPEERKLARNLRIQRRKEAQNREKKESILSTLEDSLAEAAPIPNQLKKSNRNLEGFVQELDELITNVRVANDAREVSRRNQEGLNKEKIFENLDNEAKETEKAFELITSKWIQIEAHNDPLLINDEIQKQKEKCDALIQQKDEIIAMLRGEIRKAEIHYNRDQEKQMRDINILAQRIEKSTISIRAAYRGELQIIEDLIKSERKALMELNDKKWDDLFKQREKLEEEKADSRQEALEKCEKELNDLRRDFQEEYRKTKILLENDIEQLQQTFQAIKAQVLMESEKLDYNYQILKKREDENIIIRAQQKRKLNKMQDIVNKLRNQMSDYDKDIGGRIQKYKEEVKKLQQSIGDIEKKLNHFAAVGDTKFNQLWQLNKQRAENLVKKILTIDRILHEHHLGIEWKQPEMVFAKKEDLLSYQTAIKAIEENNEEERTFSKRTPSVDLTKYKNYHQNINRIIQQISENSDFLIEDKLEIILKPYENQHKRLVKVDHVFEALGLNNKDDITVMMEFFLPYAICDTCYLKNTTTEDIETDPETLSVKSELEDDSSDSRESLDSMIYFEDNALKLYDNATDNVCKGPEGDVTIKEKAPESKSKVLETGKDVCLREHGLFVHTSFVLKALREFIDKYYSRGATNTKIMPQMKRTTVARLISEEDIKSYWLKYLDFFPEEKEKLWDGLLTGLKKYHVLLKERKKLCEEVINLRQQNKELRHLLLSHVDNY